jgi:hypothetical protein
LAHPTGFEPVASAFGGQRTEHFLDFSKFLKIPQSSDFIQFNCTYVH